jgi:ATP-dependent protease ClpP protease subunit
MVKVQTLGSDVVSEVPITYPALLTFPNPVSDESIDVLLDQTIEVLRHSNEATLFISSGGGDLTSAFGFYDHMSWYQDKHKVRLTTVGQGSIMSSALVMLQAGVVRQSFPHTVFMMHEPTYNVESGKTAFQTHNMVGMGESQKLAIDLLCKILASKSGVPASDWRHRMETGKDVYFGAEQARKWGLIDGILR